MGDRSNIVIRQFADEKSVLVVYSHHAGSSIGDMLRKAMQAAQGRLDDPSYGARQIVANLVKGTEKQGTGMGLYATTDGLHDDNEYNLVFVDMPAQIVAIIPVADAEKVHEWKPGPKSKKWSFIDFICREMNLPEIPVVQKPRKTRRRK